MTTRDKPAAVILGAMMFASLLNSAPASARPVAAGVSPSAATAVTIKDFLFSPKVVTISKGTKVKWTNKGPSTHTTTSNTGLWSKTLAPGTSFARTFNSVGTFKYHCMIHPFMKGTINVTA